MPRPAWLGLLSRSKQPKTRRSFVVESDHLNRDLMVSRIYQGLELSPVLLQLPTSHPVQYSAFKSSVILCNLLLSALSPRLASPNPHPRASWHCSPRRHLSSTHLNLYNTASSWVGVKIPFGVVFFSARLEIDSAVALSIPLRLHKPCDDQRACKCACIRVIYICFCN